MRLPLALYLVALAARALTGLLHPDPAYPDSFYYVAVARSLAAGHGFTVNFIWNFVDVGGRLPADPTLPIPSNAHWMPLASLVQVPFLLVFGVTPAAALIPFLLSGALAAPIAWAVARDAGLSQTQGFAAGLMAAVPGAVTPFLGQPDNFALFMPLGALALWLCARGLRGDMRAFVLGGLVVGLATLARNDGVLLGVPFVVGWLWNRVRSPARGSRLPVGSAVGCVLLFALVMGPWYERQVSVFGSVSPSASNGRILWITAYPQLFSVSGNPTLASFLAQGWPSLLESRLGGFSSALTILAAEPLLLFLVPFVLWASWSRRRSVWFGPWLLYGAILVLFSGFLFAVHVPYGTFLHSAVALLPHAYVLVVEGIALAVAWTGSRLRHWNVPRATVIFTAIGVLVLWLGGAVASWKVLNDWGAEEDRRRAVAALLSSQAGPGDRLMSADPGGYWYLTGMGGVVTPEDPLATVETVARAYHVRWLVLEPAHIVQSLAAVYVGTTPVPSWLTQVSEAPTASSGPLRPVVSANGRLLPAFRVYAVCLDRTDPRPACRGALP